MNGAGQAHGAITIVNATAAGRGCALAVVDGMSATWTWRRADHWQWNGPADDAVARAVRDLLRDAGIGGPGAEADTVPAWPAARGLKTSSQAAASLLQAALAAAGVDADARTRIDWAVAACRDAGVTLTGALDDQAAVVLGGCALTDNAEGRIISTREAPDLHVAVWVPATSIPKVRVAQVPLAKAVAGARMAWDHARTGALAEALKANHEAYAPVYVAAGLPVQTRPVEVATSHGALAAGLSGTGPAIAALFDAPVRLPPVAGGRWHWTRTVPLCHAEVRD